MKEYLRVIFISTLFIFNFGCATNKDTFNSSDTPTMKEIYDEQFEKFEQPENYVDNEMILTSESYDFKQEENLPDDVVDLKKEFSMLPNPVLLMYIPAHLTTGGTPVPGYSTYFSMFERNHVALPSERPD